MLYAFDQTVNEIRYAPNIDFSFQYRYNSQYHSKGGEDMRTRPVEIIMVVLSAFASFIVCLCVSLADITPILIVALLAAAAALARIAPIICPYTAVKLYTQKRE
jgi:hypothetical protein